MKPDGTDVTTKVLAIYDSERQAQIQLHMQSRFSG